MDENYRLCSIGRKHLSFIALLVIVTFYVGLNAGIDNFIGKRMFFGTITSPMNYPEYIVIKGFIDNEGNITVSPVYTTRNRTIEDCAGEGIFSIELFDSGGKRLFSSSFNVESMSVIQRDGSDRKIDSGQFMFKIPFYENADKIVIKKESLLLWERVKSKSSPQVSFLNPRNGDNIKGENINIAIEASDKDMDKLYFMIEYSPDEGRTWNSLTGLFTDRVLRINSYQFSKEKILFFLFYVLTDLTL